jgi:rSAM/selenodomain-associated transferase 1
MPDTALIVMARYPEPGKTKTRLARFIGNDEAVLLYTAFLTDLAHHFAGRDYDLYWTYTPPEIDYSSFIATLAPASMPFMRCFPQQGDDLGQRLHYAFQGAYEHDYRRTIVIGSDTPHIRQDTITHALVALEDADVVLGPADDGGYYLIAMREPHDVFSDIPMSTSVVTQQTIDLAHRKGLTVRLIESLFDIDELPDLLRLARLLAADCSLAPATAAQLARLRSLHDHHTHHSYSGYSAALNLHRADQPM